MSTSTGYTSSAFGYVDTNTNGPGGTFAITADLDMAGYDIDNVSDINSIGDVNSLAVKTKSIEERDATTNILPFLSQTSETYHAETTSSGGVIILSAPAVMSGLLRFDTSTVSSFTWPDYNSVNAELSVKNDGTGNKYSAFYTVIVNQTGSNIPAAVAATGQSFEDGARNPIKNGMAHKFLSIVGNGSYQTTLVSQCTADLNSDFSVFGDLITEGGAVDADGSDLNIGAKAGTNDINIGKAGQNTVINSDNLKVDSIVSTGSGNVTIEGTGLRAQGTEVMACFGDVNAAPPTSNVKVHLEGNRDTLLVLEGNIDDNTSGDSGIYQQTQGNKFYSAITQTQANPNLVIETARESTETATDIEFKTGGSYVGAPSLNTIATPTGGTTALKIDGVNQNVEVTNQLILNSTGEPQILSDNVGFCWGTAGSSAGVGYTHNIAIGEDCTTLNGENNVAIGLRAICGGITGVALGTDAVTTASQSTVSIGWSANVSQSQGTAVGPNADVSGANASAYGYNSSAGGTSSLAIGVSANTQNNNSIALGPFTSANGVSALAIGNASTATGTNAVSICGGANAVPNSAKLFDASYGIDLAGSLVKGQTNDCWSNTAAPIVDTGTLYTQNAVSYTLDAEEIVNGIVRNTYGAGVSTITFPTRTSVVNFLENYVDGTPTAGAQTRHSMFETIIFNPTVQTVTLTAGTAQTAVGNSLSAGIPAQSCVTFKHYLSNTFYITVRTSTEALS